jgi:hypothetical protein
LLTALTFGVGVSGAKVTVGLVEIKGMALATVAAVLTSLKSLPNKFDSLNFLQTGLLSFGFGRHLTTMRQYRAGGACRRVPPLV